MLRVQMMYGHRYYKVPVKVPNIKDFDMYDMYFTTKLSFDNIPVPIAWF